MLPDLTVSLPASLMGLLVSFRPLFTAPSFRTFCALAAGFLAQTGRRTVCGMLTGAGLSRVWRHDRAHRFFSHARWSVQDLGLALARLIVAALVPDGQPVTVAIDDTLFQTGSSARSWSACRCAPGRWPCQCWPLWCTRTSSLLPRPGWSWPGR